MTKFFSNSRIILLILFFSTLMGAEAWAFGQLTLIAKTEDGKVKISLIEEEGRYFGDIREGLTVLTPLQFIQQPKYLKIGIG